jgi:hypothetical protein
MLPEGSHQASHCFAFERDFIGGWRCIPLCLRRKLDLAGIKLRLNHWLALPEQERQQLVAWDDSPAALEAMAVFLLERTAGMADGGVRPLAVPTAEPWQPSGSPPAELCESAASLGHPLLPHQWDGLSELERFALCKLARPGHDHHNLEAALVEMLA